MGVDLLHQHQPCSGGACGRHNARARHARPPTLEACRAPPPPGAMAAQAPIAIKEALLVRARRRRRRRRRCGGGGAYGARGARARFFFFAGAACGRVLGVGCAPGEGRARSGGRGCARSWERRDARARCEEPIGTRGGALAPASPDRRPRARALSVLCSGDVSVSRSSWAAAGRGGCSARGGGNGAAPSLPHDADACATSCCECPQATGPATQWRAIDRLAPRAMGTRWRGLDANTPSRSLLYVPAC